MVGVDAMQCGFMPVRSIKDAHQLQERYLEKKKQLFFVFGDMEKVFDWVPRVMS